MLNFRHPVVKWLLVLVFMSGCTRSCTETQEDLSPAQVVETFLDLALNISDIKDKKFLEQLTTGNLKKAIENATDKEIMDTYINRNYKVLSYSVIEEELKSPRRVHITFELKFKDLGTIDNKIDESVAATVTTENTVRVEKKSKLWLISETLGKTSTFDFPLNKADTIYAE